MDDEIVLPGVVENEKKEGGEQAKGVRSILLNLVAHETQFVPTPDQTIGPSESIFRAHFLNSHSSW
jgi:hypothetical protein